MKKLLLTLFATLPIITFAQDVNFIIKGKIGNLNAPVKMYLMYHLPGKPTNTYDSVMLQNGQFEFKGIAPKEPLSAILKLDKRGAGRKNSHDEQEIYLEPGLISVVSSTDSLQLATISGGLVNTDNEAYKLANKPAREAERIILAKYYAATPQQLKDVEFQAEISKLSRKRFMLSAEIAPVFIASHPNSFISFYLVKGNLNALEYPKLVSLYNSLGNDMKNSERGKILGERIENMKNAAVGTIVADFSMADTTGKMLSLSSFRGKYLLVDLWASWCAPCRAENPNYVANYKKYHDQGFEMLGVSLDRPGAKQQWIAAIQKDGLLWPQVSDLQFWNNAVAKAWGIKSIPQNILLDPNGKVVAKNLRGDSLDKKLSEIFARITTVKSE